LPDLQNIETLLCRKNPLIPEAIRRAVACYERTGSQPEELAYWNQKLHDLTEGMYALMPHPVVSGREEDLEFNTPHHRVTGIPYLTRDIRSFLGGKTRRTRRKRRSRRSYNSRRRR